MKIPVTIDIQATPFSALDQLAAAVQGASADSSEPHPRESVDPTERQEFMKALIQVAGQTWRLGTLLFDSDSGESKAELSSQDIRKLSNAVESMQEVIKSLGIRVIDRCGKDHDDGLPEIIVTEEPREGISKDLIIRTIRPTIMWGQTMVQRGEIDIAVPVSKKDEK